MTIRSVKQSGKDAKTMISAIKRLLKKEPLSVQTTSEPEADRVLTEVCSLSEQMSEYCRDTTAALEEIRTEQATMFDEMARQLFAAQQEIIDNLTLQFQAAEVLRLQQTEQIDRLIGELSATREQLDALLGAQEQSPNEESQ